MRSAAGEERGRGPTDGGSGHQGRSGQQHGGSESGGTASSNFEQENPAAGFFATARRRRATAELEAQVSSTRCGGKREAAGCDVVWRAADGTQKRLAGTVRSDATGRLAVWFTAGD